MTMNQEPLNLKLERYTPKWAFKQRARRNLVIAFYAMLFLLRILISSNSNLKPIALPLLVLAMVCLVWLVGATRARADMPDNLLDEREIADRNVVYLNAFRNLMGIVAVLYITTAIFEIIGIAIPAVQPRDLLMGLFVVGLFMPTCVMAWTQPDPISELE